MVSRSSSSGAFSCTPVSGLQPSSSDLTLLIWRPLPGTGQGTGEGVPGELVVGQMGQHGPGIDEYRVASRGVLNRDAGCARTLTEVGDLSDPGAVLELLLAVLDEPGVLGEACDVEDDRDVGDEDRRGRPAARDQLSPSTATARLGLSRSVTVR